MKGTGRGSSLGGRAVALTVSRVLTAVIGLATSMLLARFRTLNEYGTYAQIVMVIDLTSTIMLLGLPNSINYFLARADSDEERQRFMSLYYTLSTIMTASIGASLLLLTPLIITYFDNPGIRSFAYLFFMMPWSTLMMNSFGNTCIVYEKANKLIVYNIVHAVVNLLLILLAKLFQIAFPRYLLSYAIVQVLFALFAVWAGSRMVGSIRPLLDGVWIKKVFAFSIPMGLASVVGTLIVELDKLVIGYFFTTEEYAIYTNAAKELPLTMLASSLTAVLLPVMVSLLKQDKRETAIEKWACSINLSFCVMVLMVGGLVAFAPDVMTLFYSEKYVTSNSLIVFRIYSIILLFRCTYWGIVLNATGKTTYILWSSILTLVLNFFGNIAGYYVFGFIGPAIATIIVIAVMDVAQLFFTERVLRIHFWRLLPWSNILRLCAETMTLGALAVILKKTLPVPVSNTVSILEAIGIGCIWAAIFLVWNRKFIKNNWEALNKKQV